MENKSIELKLIIGIFRLILFRITKTDITLICLRRITYNSNWTKTIDEYSLIQISKYGSEKSSWVYFFNLLFFIRFKINNQKWNKI